ncbi:hypothetical protein P8452_60343 [Trifolium repens]|nr:hypothetical protein P8452_60343 [Trifolium repens]
MNEPCIQNETPLEPSEPPLTRTHRWNQIKRFTNPTTTKIDEAEHMTATKTVTRSFHMVAADINVNENLFSASIG